MTDDLISRRDAIDELTKFFCDNDIMRGDFPNCERNERKATILMENVRSIDAEPVIRCKDCIYHKEKRCTVWRERAVIVECYTDDDGFCYMAKRK